ncbi:MAG TPA: phosphoribosylglycinamide formyltransferase [Edaphocola sp.]|nr:phosphoribosylglycinamide formyltransferase [Edaphocola sp.]
MKNIILFASGAGSNVRAILDYFKDKNEIRPVAIVCNNPEAGVKHIAEEEHIPIIWTDRKHIQSNEFLSQLKDLQPDMIILAGFLLKIPDEVVKSFPQRIINIHPALLPKYGGKGMYGHHVHQSVIDNQEKESGITIHYINEHYDEGNVIIQAYCNVTSEDTPDSLAQKIHKLEHFYFPRAIALLLK